MKRRLFLGVGVVSVLVVVMLGLLVRSRLGNNHPQPAPDPFPLTPLSDSPYLNAKPNAQYVGSGVCFTCHQDKGDSFRHTGMGRSMSAVDAAHEPPDAVFDHPASKRRFQVFRKDGMLWHRELLLTSGPPEVVLSEYPLKYVVGSGRHARTYLVETDGFLVESPVTWYDSRKAWDLSPGYDVADHQGFARAVGETCLRCHAGQAEAVGLSVHRMHLGEVEIGCERCHGPGSLHVEWHRERQRLGKNVAGESDFTIVNPANLSRALAEAVCQQCHLDGEAVVPNRGRKFSDFRPGLPLQDVFQVYVPDAPPHSMTVVGHVQQMHLSRCYLGSDTFSCLTCHDPHAEPTPAASTAYYNSVCQDCHKPERCTADKQRRQQESPDNNCVQCHMPRSKTDVPHVAFTNHRVGIHDRPPTKEDSSRVPLTRIKPFLDFARMSEIDRKLSLGEGYRLAALFGTDGTRAPEYRSQALELLSGVYQAGLRDPNLESALTQLTLDAKTGDPYTLAEEALAHPDLTGQSRCNALSARAQLAGREGNFAAALKDLRELTRLRRLAGDWLLLARFLEAVGDRGGAIEALEAAVRIDTRLGAVHQYLADHYRQIGDSKRAEWHQLRAAQ